MTYFIFSYHLYLKMPQRYILYYHFEMKSHILPLVPSLIWKFHSLGLIVGLVQATPYYTLY